MINSLFDLTTKIWVGLTKTLPTIAIIIGGLWVYYRYMKDRVYHARIILSMQLQISEDLQNLYILATYEAENKGYGRVYFAKNKKDLPKSSLELFVVPHQELRDEKVFESTMGGDAAWAAFSEEDWIEGGEIIREQKLITVRRIEAIAFRVTLRVVSRGALWGMCRGSSWEVTETGFLKITPIQNYGIVLKSVNGEKNVK